MATHHGSRPTWICATLVFASPDTLNTDTESLSGLALQTNLLSLEIAMGLEFVAFHGATSGAAAVPAVAAGACDGRYPIANAASIAVPAIARVRLDSCSVLIIASVRSG